MSAAEKTTYKDFASEYDALIYSTPYYKNQLEAEKRLLRDHIPKAKPGQWALDLGCGTGLHTQALLDLGYNVTAVDISSDMLEGVKRRTADVKDRMEYFEMDARKVDTLKRQYDAVIGLGCLISHFPEWDEYFKKLRTVMKPMAPIVFSCDSALGSDYVGWTLARIFYPNDKHQLGIEDFFKSLNTVVLNGSWTDDWEYKLPSRTIQFTEHFYSMDTLTKAMKDAGIDVTDRRGANIVSCMIPSLVRTSSQIGLADDDTKKLGDIVKDVDHLLAPLWWAGTVWLVAGKRD